MIKVKVRFFSENLINDFLFGAEFLVLFFSGSQPLTLKSSSKIYQMTTFFIQNYFTKTTSLFSQYSFWMGELVIWWLFNNEGLYKPTFYRTWSETERDYRLYITYSWTLCQYSQCNLELGQPWSLRIWTKGKQRNVTQCFIIILLCDMSIEYGKMCIE